MIVKLTADCCVDNSNLVILIAEDLVKVTIFIEVFSMQ